MILKWPSCVGMEVRDMSVVVSVCSEPQNADLCGCMLPVMALPVSFRRDIGEKVGWA